MFGHENVKKLELYRKARIPKITLSKIVRSQFRTMAKEGLTLNGDAKKEGSSIEQLYGEKSFRALIGNVK